MRSSDSNKVDIPSFQQRTQYFLYLMPYGKGESNWKIYELYFTFGIEVSSSETSELTSTES